MDAGALYLVAEGRELQMRVRAPRKKHGPRGRQVAGLAQADREAAEGMAGAAEICSRPSIGCQPRVLRNFRKVMP